MEHSQRAALAGLGAAVLLGLLLGASAGAGPRDPLYVWTDSAGAVRYTTDLERIPAARRDSASPVVAGMDGDLDEQIARLEARIAADEAALGDWLSDPDRAEDRDSLRAVAERLPRLQAQLRALRARQPVGP